MVFERIFGKQRCFINVKAFHSSEITSQTKKAHVHGFKNYFTQNGYFLPNTAFICLIMLDLCL